LPYSACTAISYGACVPITTRKAGFLTNSTGHIILGNCGKYGPKCELYFEVTYNDISADPEDVKLLQVQQTTGWNIFADIPTVSNVGEMGQNSFQVNIYVTNGYTVTVFIGWAGWHHVDHAMPQYKIYAWNNNNLKWYFSTALYPARCTVWNNPADPFSTALDTWWNVDESCLQGRPYFGYNSGDDGSDDDHYDNRWERQVFANAV
jgi:hypothetical protein